jgi:hypothetical protein
MPTLKKSPSQIGRTPRLPAGTDGTLYSSLRTAARRRIRLSGPNGTASDRRICHPLALAQSRSDCGVVRPAAQAPVTRSPPHINVNPKPR